MTGDFFYWKQCKLEMRTTSSQHGKNQKPKAIVNLEILPNENVFQNKGEHFLHQNYTTKKKKIKVLQVDETWSYQKEIKSTGNHTLYVNRKTFCLMT